jgi:hypothetical protein
MGVAGDRSAGCAPAVRRRAVTLIEAVLFIAVALAVIVGGLAFYQQASIALTTQKTIRLTSAISAEFAAVGTVFGDISELLVKRGSIPATSIMDPPWMGCHLKSPWGECSKVFGFDNPDAVEPFLYVHFLSMPRPVCQRLLPHDDEGYGRLGRVRWVLIRKVTPTATHWG